MNICDYMYDQILSKKIRIELGNTPLLRCTPEDLEKQVEIFNKAYKLEMELDTVHRMADWKDKCLQMLDYYMEAYKAGIRTAGVNYVSNVIRAMYICHNENFSAEEKEQIHTIIQNCYDIINDLPAVTNGTEIEAKEYYKSLLPMVYSYIKAGLSEDESERAQAFNRFLEANMHMHVIMVP